MLGVLYFTGVADMGCCPKELEENLEPHVGSIISLC